MKIIPFIACSLLSLFCYAEENTHIFIGQNNHNGSYKTAFILELMNEDLTKNILINDQGEIYLKVDHIVAIPKENLLHFMALSGVKELPLDQLAKQSDAKLKDLGVSDKTIEKIDSKQQRFQTKLEKQTAKMKLKKNSHL